MFRQPLWLVIFIPNFCWRKKKVFPFRFLNSYYMLHNIYDENLLNRHKPYMYGKYIQFNGIYRFSIWNLYNRRAIRIPTFLAIVLFVLTILNKQKGPKVIFLYRVWGGNDFRVIGKPIVRQFLFFLISSHIKVHFMFGSGTYVFVDIFRAKETKTWKELLWGYRKI